MFVTPYDIAERFVGMKEVPGRADNPQILAMLRLDDAWPEHDEVPWCSAFLNYVAWLLRLPRSKSLAARSWLGVGHALEVYDARIGFDVVVFERPGTVNGGHVGLFAGRGGTQIFVLGGNQSDGVTIAPYPMHLVLGVRRLSHAGPGQAPPIRT